MHSGKRVLTLLLTSAFLPLVWERAVSLPNKVGVVFILLHLAKGSLFFTWLWFFYGYGVIDLVGFFVFDMLTFEQSIL